MKTEFLNKLVEELASEFVGHYREKNTVHINGQSQLIATVEQISDTTPDNSLAGKFVSELPYRQAQLWVDSKLGGIYTFNEDQPEVQQTITTEEGRTYKEFVMWLGESNEGEGFLELSTGKYFYEHELIDSEGFSTFEARVVNLFPANEWGGEREDDWGHTIQEEMYITFNDETTPPDEAKELIEKHDFIAKCKKWCESHDDGELRLATCDNGDYSLGDLRYFIPTQYAGVEQVSEYSGIFIEKWDDEWVSRLKNSWEYMCKLVSGEIVQYDVTVWVNFDGDDDEDNFDPPDSHEGWSLLECDGYGYSPGLDIHSLVRAMIENLEQNEQYIDWINKFDETIKEIVMLDLDGSMEFTEFMRDTFNNNPDYKFNYEQWEG